MRRIVGKGLLVLDCLVVSFWVMGFALMATGNLQGSLLVVHAVTVSLTAVAQLYWGFKCPLMIWSNKLHGNEFGHVLNPFLISFAQKFLRVSWSTANKILSTIIMLGGIFYLSKVFY